MREPTTLWRWLRICRSLFPLLPLFWEMSLISLSLTFPRKKLLCYYPINVLRLGIIPTSYSISKILPTHTHPFFFGNPFSPESSKANQTPTKWTTEKKTSLAVKGRTTKPHLITGVWANLYHCDVIHHNQHVLFFLCPCIYDCPKSAGALIHRHNVVHILQHTYCQKSFDGVWCT